MDTETTREKVKRYLAQGLTIREISILTQTSTQNVAKHRASLKRAATNGGEKKESA